MQEKVVIKYEKTGDAYFKEEDRIKSIIFAKKESFERR
jgi:hypothetical protein